MANAKRILYTYDGAPELYAGWRRGTDPATHLFGIPTLETLGWQVTIKDFSEFQGLFGALRLFRAARSADVVLTVVGISLLLLPTWTRGKTPWVVLPIDVVMVYRRKNFFKQYLMRIALKRAAAIACLAEFQMEFLRSIGIPQAKLFFVPLGGDPKFYHAEHPTEEFIFAVGRDPGRDFGTLIEAARDLPVPLMIATSKKIVGTLPPLPPNVEIKENTPLLVTRDLLARSIVVVIPSRATGGSDCSGQTVLLDAWATGKPVVVSGREWTRSYVRDGVDAIMVHPEDPAALKEALERLIRDPKLRERLARAGYERVCGEYSSARMGERLDKLFGALVLS